MDRLNYMVDQKFSINNRLTGWTNLSSFQNINYQITLCFDESILLLFNADDNVKMGSKIEKSCFFLIYMIILSAIQPTCSLWLENKVEKSLERILTRLEVMENQLDSMAAQIDYKCSLLKQAASNRQVNQPPGPPAPLPGGGWFERPRLPRPPGQPGASPNLRPGVEPGPESGPGFGPIRSPFPTPPSLNQNPFPTPNTTYPFQYPNKNSASPQPTCPKVECKMRMCDINNLADMDCFRYVRKIRRRSHLIERDHSDVAANKNNDNDDDDDDD